jgi:hypothetical protein
MEGEVSLPGEINKAGIMCESVHDMISPLLTDASNLLCLASVSSPISTGHQIHCPFILEKELTPVYLPATLYSQNKTAIAATNQHTAMMLTNRVRTPLGSLDPKSLHGTSRQNHNVIYNVVALLIYSYTNFF